MSNFNYQDLEDAYQNAEVKCLTYIKKGRKIKSKTAFKYKVAHNYLIDLLKSGYKRFRKKFNIHQVTGANNPLDLVIANEETHQFNNTVSLLNLREQAIIRYLLAGVRVKDISTLLNLTPDHISVIIQRAKIKIQRILNLKDEAGA